MANTKESKSQNQQAPTAQKGNSNKSGDKSSTKNPKGESKDKGQTKK